MQRRSDNQSVSPFQLNFTGEMVNDFFLMLSYVLQCNVIVSIVKINDMKIR